MPRKRGEIEVWLRRIFFGRDRSKYVVLVRYRIGSEEELRPIPAKFIDDIRRGYIVVGEDMIPFHRVEEIRTTNGVLLYKRSKKTFEEEKAG